MLDEKSHKRILVYDILHKTWVSAKALLIGFDNVDGFIRVFYGTRYLVLFNQEKYDVIYNRIRCLIGVKSGITYDISHNYAKFKVDSYDWLPPEKTLILHSIIIFIISVFNKDNNYYHSSFLVRVNYFKITITIKFLYKL